MLIEFIQLEKFCDGLNEYKRTLHCINTLVSSDCTEKMSISILKMLNMKSILVLVLFAVSLDYALSEGEAGSDWKIITNI